LVKCFVFPAQLEEGTPFLTGPAVPKVLVHVVIIGHAVLPQPIVLLRRQHADLEALNAPVVLEEGTPFLTGPAVPKVLVHVLIIGHAVLPQPIVLLRRRHADLEALNAPVAHQVVI
jgi:hypothetical protein